MKTRTIIILAAWAYSRLERLTSEENHLCGSGKPTQPTVVPVPRLRVLILWSSPRCAPDLMTSEHTRPFVRQNDLEPQNRAAEMLSSNKVQFAMGIGSFEGVVHVI